MPSRPWSFLTLAGYGLSCQRQERFDDPVVCLRRQFFQLLFCRSFEIDGVGHQPFFRLCARYSCKGRDGSFLRCSMVAASIRSSRNSLSLSILSTTASRVFFGNARNAVMNTSDVASIVVTVFLLQRTTGKKKSSLPWNGWRPCPPKFPTRWSKWSAIMGSIVTFPGGFVKKKRPLASFLSLIPCFSCLIFSQFKSNVCCPVPDLYREFY